MQTFLPVTHPTLFLVSDLDDQRLGKQRVEGLQILTTLVGESDGWRYHPATKMWIGYELSLSLYVNEICDEWVSRGFTDNVGAKVDELFARFHMGGGEPWWLGEDEFHRAHRSNLIRKRPDLYADLWPGTPDDLPYLWPCNECQVFYPTNSCTEHRGDRRQHVNPVRRK